MAVSLTELSKVLTSLVDIVHSKDFAESYRESFEVDKVEVVPMDTRCDFKG